MSRACLHGVVNIIGRLVHFFCRPAWMRRQAAALGLLDFSRRPAPVMVVLFAPGIVLK